MVRAFIGYAKAKEDFRTPNASRTSGLFCATFCALISYLKAENACQ